MTDFPSSSTRRRLEQELRSRWQQGDRQALQSLLRTLPPEQQAAVLQALLPEELRLRREHGEKCDPETLRALIPGAGNELNLPNQSNLPAEDPSTLRFGVSGDWFAESASWAERVDWPSSLERLGKPHLPQEVSAQVASQENTPKQIDQYELLHELGRGGMGVVWKALDHQLKRIVAVKMLLGGPFSDPVGRSRFRREAQLLAQVQHPHLVQVFGVGEHNGVPYLVMEYIEGITLAAFARRRPIDSNLAAYYVEKIARAVQAAHERGIIHRDLKPGNILLGLPSEGSGVSDKARPRISSQVGDVNPYMLVPKLTDFGLAKRLDGQTLATTAGEVLGTLHYMAPEQAKGDASLIGPAVDVYGLGAVLYELLTGLPPISGGNLLEMMTLVQSSDPAAPTLHNPSLPRDLETICLKCLEKDPRRRYASAADLADDLGRFLRREPISARPVSELEKLWRWCQRNPTVAGLSAALILSLVTLVVVFAWQLAKTRAAYAVLADRNQQLAVARDHAQRSRLLVERQRDEFQREAARSTFLQAVELAERGDPALALFQMKQAMQLALPDMADFRRVVLTCLAGWSHYVPEVIDYRDLGEDWFFKLDEDGVHAWIWGKGSRHLEKWNLKVMEKVGQPVPLPEGGKPLHMSNSGRWLLVHVPQPPSYQVLDVYTGKKHGEISFPGASPWNAAIRDDGQVLATLDADGRIRVWELPSGKTLAGPIFFGARRHFQCRLTFGQEGDLLAYLLEGGSMGLLLDGKTFQPQSLPPEETPVALLSRERLLTLKNDGSGRLSLLDRRSRKLLGEYVLPSATWIGLFQENGAGDTLLGNISGDLPIFWDYGSGRLRWGPLRAREPFPIIVDPDMRIAATRWQRFLLPRPPSAMVKPASLEIGIGQALRGYAPCTSVLKPEAGWAATIQRQPAEGVLLLRFVHPQTAMPLGSGVLLNGDHSFGLATSADGRKVAVLSHRYGLLAGWVHLVSAPSGELLGPPLEHTNYTSALAFSPDGERLAVGDYNRQILIWDLRTRKLAIPPLQETDIVISVAWSPDGRTLAVGTSLDYSKQPHFRLWNPDNGKPLSAPVMTRNIVDGVIFSPDSQWLVAQTKEQAWLMEVATGQTRVLPVSFPKPNAVVFNRDGNMLAVGSGANKVTLIRTQTGEVVDFTPGRSSIVALAFSTDSHTLAVGYHDGTVRLWDIKTRLPLSPPYVHGSAVSQVACLPGDQGLIVASVDGQIRLWPWPKLPAIPEASIGQLLESYTGLTLEGDSLRVLTPQEWRQRYLTLPLEASHNPFGRRIPEKAWLEVRAREAEAENQLEAASYYLNRLLDLSPDDPQLLLRRANNQFLLGDRLGAELDAKRAAWLLDRLGTPSKAESWHLHEMVTQAFHGRQELAQWHADWLQENAEMPLSLWQTAHFYRRIGLVPLAAKCEQTALNKGLPSHLKYELALRYAEEGNWDQAKGLLQQTLAEAVPPLLLMSRVAVALAKTGQLASAPLWLENFLETMETRAPGGWVRTHVWTLITLPCPSAWRQRALARIEALRPPPSEPLAAAYDASAGALLIRLGQPQAGAARILAALPNLDFRAKPAALAMLALAALSQDDLTSARQYHEEALVHLKAVDSFWNKQGAELLLEEIKQRLPNP